jgi:exoribonuclease R
MVRSRAQLSYEEAQEQIDQATGSETLRLLAEVGRLREMQEVSRDAVTLDTPEQQIVERPGGWALRYRAPLPVEGWNAQISILTGIFAAGLMVDAGRGMLRTLPPSPPERIQRLRRVARGLRIAWPEHLGYPDLIRSLNARIPAHAAFLAEATGLFTGAGYQVLEDGETPRPHSALATIYSHVTAPLRRLADRYVGETCLAICEDRPLPEWVRTSLPALPEVMARSASLAGRYEAECVNLVEAALLSGRIGEVFAGIVIEVDRGKPTGDVQLHDPAVLARVTGEDLDLGEELMVRLTDVSVEQRRVEFSQT